MADKDSKKLKNLFFFGVSFANYDTSDVTLDIITNIRRRFLITKKPASNKLYRSAKGESFVYAYNFSFDRPLQWRVTRNKRIVEEIVPLLSGKYCINLYDENGKDLKKTFFDSKHRWFKTNYYSPVSNEHLVCSLVPKNFDEGTSLLKYMTGEIYPERLFPCSLPSCEDVRQKVVSKIPTPMVTALTNVGIVYFMPEDDMENYEHVLAEEEEIYKAENSPKVYVTEEDAASGFNLSANDFDMSKNLNRTFDISLAEDFDAADIKVQPADEVTDDNSHPAKPDITDDDGSVDAAISDVVKQINSLTALDINADDILNFDINVINTPDTDDTETPEDYIIFENNNPAIDEQLRHIDSVLDGSSLLNSNHQLVIGDSVVDEDYISSIIDGLISSAFDAKDFDDADEDTEITQDASTDIDLAEEASDTEEALEEDQTPEPETDKSPELLPNVYEDNLALNEDISVHRKAEDYLNENPADIRIDSRGEVYSYYGSVDENGKRSGRGRTLMSDGNIAYEGEYEDDKRKGQGSFYFKDGSLCYWGNWDNNVRSGFGVGVSSEDKAVHAGNWVDNKPSGTGVRFDSEGNLMFVSSNCTDKKKGITISDLSDTSFTVRAWSEKDDAFIQREFDVNDIIK